MVTAQEILWCLVFYVELTHIKWLALHYRQILILLGRLCPVVGPLTPVGLRSQGNSRFNTFCLFLAREHAKV